ncbi:EAL domain-containing protein [Roseateles albus]|uniref:EAL domain-containing protein n=1 Tax=Roseateles albus TaxID=2987525 RepID=A0ABT5KHP1_9BURK|nr:EAL domain-containing protein [Roseateles albus]MDC8773457.1 EAL domain-containing protein [Roseateles albus]
MTTDTTEDPGPQTAPLSHLPRASLRTLLLVIVGGFAISTVSMIWVVSREFNALAEVNRQVEAAGRLRMLSQHVALLAHRASRDGSVELKQFENAVREFDVKLAELRAVEDADLDTAHIFALDRVEIQWQRLKSLSQGLVKKAHITTYAEELDLAQIASATLKAAEENVELYLPAVDDAKRRIAALFPLSILWSMVVLSGLVWLLRKRIFQPLLALGMLMDKIAAGELSIRGAAEFSDEIGRLVHHVNHVAECLERDNSVQQTTLAELRDSEIRHRTLWEMSSEAIVTLNVNGIIAFANPAVFGIFGYQPVELIGKAIAVLQPERLRERHLNGMARYKASGRRSLDWASIETQGLHKDGHEIQLELAFTDMQLSQTRWFVGTFRDITQRKAHQEALMRSANYDALTNLPNRLLLYDRIEHAIAFSKRHGSTFAVLYLDLDNFKIINDTLGHECGDLLLCEAARRLLTCVRDGDTVARMGGDEFVLVLSEMQSKNDVDRVAQRALDVMSASFNLASREAFVGVSIGASVFPDDASTRVDLLLQADIAMYKAKDLGRNNYQRYSEQMQARFKWRMSTEVLLRHAIEADELVLHYQPQIDLRSGRIVGAEALIRWESPSLGRISPAQFIPLAEETGLIVPIGRWVIERACRDAASWMRSTEGAHCVVAINLSARQFNEEALMAGITSALSENQLAAHHVEFEITESMVMQDPVSASGILKKLRDMGCKVALDDFGTGYSSLAYLRTFPLDCLKIDRSLVTDVAIVCAVVQMAQAFGFKTLAEGVEDEAVLAVLQDVGCDIVQGYYYARPMPLEEFKSYLRSHSEKFPASVN